MEEIDQSNATLFIHYDPDTKMIYLAGKVSFIYVIVDYILELQPIECAEKVVSNRPAGLVDFVIRQVNFVGLVIMTLGLGNASQSQLARRASCKTDFLCTLWYFAIVNVL